MKFIVDRKTWHRGNGSDSSRLLRKEDGKRCCIGFCAQQLNIPDEKVLDRGAIIVDGSGTKQRGVEQEWPMWMRQTSRDDIYKAYSANDNSSLRDDERESQLKEIFLRNGDEIEFIN